MSSIGIGAPISTPLALAYCASRASASPSMALEKRASRFAARSLCQLPPALLGSQQPQFFGLAPHVLDRAGPTEDEVLRLLERAKERAKWKQ
jgi:hypothetical protein